MSSVIVTSGVCSAITPTLSVQVENFCNNQTQCQGGVTLIPSSSFGGPYTYFVDNVQQNSPVVFGLCGGGHTAQVIDGDGNLSDIVSFNIVSTTPSLISYESCSYSSGSIVNLNSGGNQKWNFQTNLYDIPNICKLRHKIRIAYQYTNFGYISGPTSQVNITPELPSGIWNLISTATSTQTTVGCGTYNVTTVIYESPNYNVVSTPYNLLISNCGFSWIFNNPIGTNSGCSNGDIKVRGVVTVKMVSLTSSGNGCCVITPADYNIGVSPSVEVKWRKNLQPLDTVSLTGTVCNPSSPAPPADLFGL
jgi:hypothetical protein